MEILMKKALIIFSAVLSFSLSSCIEHKIPAKLTIDTESHDSFGEFSITPMNESVTFSAHDITIKSETEGVSYTISGYCNGQITVKTKNTRLILNNAFIENTRGKAAVKSTAKLIVEAAEGSRNFIVSSGRNFSKSAALQSKQDLILDGSGELYVSGSTYHGAEAEDVLIKGKGPFFFQGSWKGSALSCESFSAQKVEDASCFFINSKNGIKAEQTIDISCGTFHFYNNTTALKTERSKNDGKKRGITLKGGQFHIHANSTLVHTDVQAAQLDGATFIEE